MKSLLDRVKDRCKVDEATGCWVWTQNTHVEGYPTMRVSSFSKKPMLVRRLVYELAVGVLSDRKVVTTTCGEVKCCNPAHLKLTNRSAVGTETLIHVNKLMTPEFRRKNRLKGLGQTPKNAWHP